MTNSVSDWRMAAARVINASDQEELERGYDDWASTYDADHVHFGNTLLVHFVGMFCRHVAPGTRPILDAGAGTGRVGETLFLHGYAGFFGIDLSAGMLRVAASKPGYEQVRRMRLGEPLDFPDHHFPVVASLAAMSPAHIGPGAFDELLRITQPGGLLVLSLRAQCDGESSFDIKRHELEQKAMWQLVDETPTFLSHPELEPPLHYAVHVYRKLETS